VTPDTDTAETSGEARTYDPALPRYVSVGRTPEGLVMALEVQLRFGVRYDRTAVKTVPDSERDFSESAEVTALNWARENGFIPADSHGNARSIRSKAPLNWNRDEKDQKVKRLRVVARSR
jgi:hypothetical protein